MATVTTAGADLLHEAAAILEAEWIRLQQDMALWEREVADLPAELTAPRPGPPRVVMATTMRRRSAHATAGDRRRWRPRRSDVAAPRRISVSRDRSADALPLVVANIEGSVPAVGAAARGGRQLGLWFGPPPARASSHERHRPL